MSYVDFASPRAPPPAPSKRIIETGGPAFFFRHALRDLNYDRQTLAASH
jgi:hypothetical protein